jgi:hypothetical protein
MARAASDQRDEQPWHDLSSRYRLRCLSWRSRRYQVFEADDVRRQHQVVVTLAQDLEPDHVVASYRVLRSLAQVPSELIPEICELDSFGLGRFYVVVRASQGESVERLLQEQRPLAPALAARLVIGLCRSLDVIDLECSIVRGLSSAFVNLVQTAHGNRVLQLTMAGLLSDIELCELGAWPGMEAQQLCWLFARLSGVHDPAEVPALAAVFQSTFVGPDAAHRRDVVTALAPLAARASGTVPIGSAR